ncbi:hypothetical protein GW793_02680 [bacterium]|uniref:DUF948 domain-containing protein n=2 Tax=Katanobacteria TaxID=422282 RepID=A0A2M7X4A7_UNCKA|nr:hypothetical protein [bacterium]PIP56260.1 MAG: hypothetical protein COX05_03940 [candidate division WWE3 bacterium CG22_combo_CG10-13_8_21_14_all_39_12]PJA40831.1 MAG: hypothetical protein CO179_01255 [candidate division WWE3 bacterium CG_4_9_14_3_um_filter_39_7]
MDTTTQVILIVMIIVLGSTLSLVGVMLFLVLKDLRVSIARFNDVLVDAKAVSEHLSQASVSIDDMVTGLKTSVNQIQSQISSPLGSMLGVMNFVRGLVSRKGGDE